MTHTHKSIKCQTCECADSTELGSNKRDASQVGKLKPEKKEKKPRIFVCSRFQKCTGYLV